MTRTNSSTSSRIGAKQSKASHKDAATSKSKNKVKDKLPAKVGFKPNVNSAGEATP